MENRLFIVLFLLVLTLCACCTIARRGLLALAFTSLPLCSFDSRFFALGGSCGRRHRCAHWMWSSRPFRPPTRALSVASTLQTTISPKPCICPLSFPSSLSPSTARSIVIGSVVVLPNLPVPGHVFTCSSLSGRFIHVASETREQRESVHSRDEIAFRPSLHHHFFRGGLVTLRAQL